MSKQDKRPSMSINLLPTAEGRTQHSVTRVGDSLAVRLDGLAILDHLTSNSKTHLEARIEQFTTQVITEAKAIEQREHVGKGPPEVTAAHIDEAWWVLRRRIRGARRPVLAGLSRAVQALGAAGLGIGGSSFQAKWGQTLFMVSSIVTFSAYLLEMYAGKRD